MQPNILASLCPNLLQSAPPLTSLDLVGASQSRLGGILEHLESSRGQCEAKLEPNLSQVVTRFGMFGTIWAKLGLIQANLKSSLAKMVPRWSKLGPRCAKMKPRWAKLPPIWPDLEPTWAQVCSFGIYDEACCGTLMQFFKDFLQKL